MAIDTLRSNESVQLVKEGDIVNVNGELNVAGMTSAGPSVLTASSATGAISFHAMTFTM